MGELAKAPVEFKAEDTVKNFDTYFPGQAWLEESEKLAMMNAIENGEMEISCNF
jgi:hypothetical protein